MRALLGKLGSGGTDVRVMGERAWRRPQIAASALWRKRGRFARDASGTSSPSR
jgi:hypothetical protein